MDNKRQKRGIEDKAQFSTQSTNGSGTLEGRLLIFTGVGNQKNGSGTENKAQFSSQSTDGSGISESRLLSFTGEGDQKNGGGTENKAQFSSQSTHGSGTLQGRLQSFTGEEDQKNGSWTENKALFSSQSLDGSGTSEGRLLSTSGQSDQKNGDGKGETVNGNRVTGKSDEVKLFFGKTPEESKKFMDDWKAAYLKKAREDAQERRRQRLEKEERDKAIRAGFTLEKKPMLRETIKVYMTSPMTAEIHSTFFDPFKNLATRCDPVLPDKKFISQHQMGRMKQLIECFPDGVAVQYFLELYGEVLGDRVKLNGYSFPVDEDRNVTFKLPIFWIPDNAECHLPERIVFPLQSRKKHGGSLKAVLENYWKLLLKYMENKKVVALSDLFSGYSDAPYFHAITGIWFSFRQWGLASYVQFFEILLENFDPMQEKFTIRYYLDEENGLSQAAYLLIAGEYAENFMIAVARNFNGPSEIEVYKQENANVEEVYVVEKKRMNWEYEFMNFVALKEIESQDPASRFNTVIASGNIKSFQPFSVIRVGDIRNRDNLLETINQLVANHSTYTVPGLTVEKSLVLFQNTTTFRPTWRRGMVLRTDGEEGALTVMDIDTGETRRYIPRNSVRNMTLQIYQLPVYNIPVRFSINLEMQKILAEDLEAVGVLGKCLHMMLVEVERGLRLRFHWWDTRSSHYIPGMWVVTGYLTNIFTGEAMKPRVSLGAYLVRKYRNGEIGKELPEWTAESEEDVWGPAMRLRLSPIESMINFYYGLGAQIRKQEQEDPIRRSIPTKIPTEMSVDEREEETPIGKIFRDPELKGWTRLVPQPILSGIGIAKMRRCRVVVKL